MVCSVKEVSVGAYDGSMIIIDVLACFNWNIEHKKAKYCLYNNPNTKFRQLCFYFSSRLSSWDLYGY